MGDARRRENPARVYSSNSSPGRNDALRKVPAKKALRIVRPGSRRGLALNFSAQVYDRRSYKFRHSNASGVKVFEKAQEFGFIVCNPFAWDQAEQFFEHWPLNIHQDIKPRRERSHREVRSIDRPGRV